MTIDTDNHTYLQPCPFCGGKAEWQTGKYGDGAPWRYICCSVCEAQAPALSRQVWNEASATEAWNNRADDAELIRLRGEVERMQAAGRIASAQMAAIEETARDIKAQRNRQRKDARHD